MARSSPGDRGPTLSSPDESRPLARSDEEALCRQILVQTAKSVGAAAGALLLGASGEAPRLRCSWGERPTDAMLVAAGKAFSGSTVVESGAGTTPSMVAIPILDGADPMGVLVLQRPRKWQRGARDLAGGGAKILACSLSSARLLRESREQGDLLARRHRELEALHALTDRLPQVGSEEEMFQTALDLVLEKLDLHTGWIFRAGPGGALELAASRGVSAEFADAAAHTGVEDCRCQDVLRGGRSVLARNTVDCPRMPPPSGSSRGHACVPLRFDTGVVGVMNVVNRPGQVFSSAELQFLETVGHHLCLAIDKLRTVRAESRRNAEARALASLASAIGGTLDQERVLAAVSDYARDLLRADRCSIFLGDGSEPPLFAYLSGPPLEGLTLGQKANLVSLGSRAPLSALRERRTLVIEDASQDRNANADLARRWNSGSAILVPLVSHDHVEGVLFADRRSRSRWGHDEIDLANALARHAALAIENARLYRETQDALLRLQEAQYGMMRAERLAAVGTLASSLAHEVRNPLNSINLQLVLLSRRSSLFDKPAREQLQQLIETARREITRLDALVEEFLSLSTLDRLSLGDVAPQDVLHEVAALMEPAARERGISFVEQSAEDIPRLRMDREKIKQVLINLVRNGIEAMPEGGALNLACRPDGDGNVILSIADTGHGIDSGLDVFDFFMTTKRGGTGLGLPIARRIVEAHGGRLTYTSQRGVGTIFSVSLKPPKPEGLS